MIPAPTEVTWKVTLISGPTRPLVWDGGGLAASYWNVSAGEKCDSKEPSDY